MNRSLYSVSTLPYNFETRKMPKTQCGPPRLGQHDMELFRNLFRLTGGGSENQPVEYRVIFLNKVE